MSDSLDKPLADVNENIVTSDKVSVSVESINNSKLFRDHIHNKKNSPTAKIGIDTMRNLILGFLLMLMLV